MAGCATATVGRATDAGVDQLIGPRGEVAGHAAR
jgi:hypothetical protein